MSPSLSVKRLSAHRVNGEILYEDGRCTKIDEDRLREKVHAERKKLFKRAKLI